MPTRLLQRLAASEAAAHLRFGSAGMAARFGPLSAVASGQGTPLDSLWHDGSRPPTPAELAQAEDFCIRHAQPVTLHLLSHAAPELTPLLRERGYRLEYVLHAYTHDLRPPYTPALLTVREQTDVEAWAQLSARGFGPGTLATMRLVGGAAGTRLFVAERGGEDVASAAFALQDGIAAFHGTSTPAQFRGVGAQTALLSHRLQVAKSLGASFASVFVTPGSGSERNVERAGFKLAGMRLSFVRS